MKDQVVRNIIAAEAARQNDEICLIASENYVSDDVTEAQGSIFTNKYAEGSVGRRYYGGCQYADELEAVAIARATKLFNCSFANVQPHSGSQANQAVYQALLKPGDSVLALSLDCGGHLTHGHKVNASGKNYNFHHYGVTAYGNINIDEARTMARGIPDLKLIVVGYSAYVGAITEDQYRMFREIADEVGAKLMVDMAHFAGFVAAGLHANPLEYADVVTTTTHKTLRGPRGGLILTNDPEIAKKIDFAVFPGIQGGPLMHVIAAKAVCFQEASTQEYREYMIQVGLNARVMFQTFVSEGCNVVGETANHQILLNTVDSFGITGKEAEAMLEKEGIIVNKNMLPNDPLPPAQCSGVRIGTPAMTTRGWCGYHFEQLALRICQILR